MLDQLEITHYFTFIFISDEMKYKKPDQNFFDYVQSKLNVPASIITLFDDEQKNIDAAVQFGWRAHLVNHKRDGFLVLDPYLK